jgi:hypothetical protein
MSGRLCGLSDQVPAKLNQAIRYQTEEVSQAKQVVSNNFCERRRGCDRQRMVSLTIRQLPMTVAANRQRLIMVLTPRDVVRFETSRITFSATRALRRVCAKPRK